MLLQQRGSHALRPIQPYTMVAHAGARMRARLQRGSCHKSDLWQAWMNLDVAQTVLYHPNPSIPECNGLITLSLFFHLFFPFPLTMVVFSLTNNPSFATTPFIDGGTRSGWGSHFLPRSALPGPSSSATELFLSFNRFRHATYMATRTYTASASG